MESDNHNLTAGTYYISLGDLENNKSIPHLLRHVADYLKNSRGSITILAMALLLPDDKSDIPSIVLDITIDNEDEVTQSQMYKDWAQEERIAHDPGDSVLMLPLEEKHILNRLVYRLPQGQMQDQYIQLIDSVAEYLESIPEYEAVDLTLVNLNDADAIDRPEIHITLKLCDNNMNNHHD